MTEPWPVHTVVFDLDDTLYLEREYVMSGFAAVDMWLRSERGVAGFGAKASELFTAGWRGTIFDEALRQLGLGKEDSLVPQMVKAYRKHAPKITLSPEVVEVLNWARSRFKLALISDGYLEVQERKANALRLNFWIDCLIFSDHWGREGWKPSERPFREVMARLPGAPRGYVYVGDNPRKDFIGAKALGWRTVRVRRSQGEHRGYEPSAAEAAEIEISDLAPLRTLMMSAGQRT